MTDFQTDITEQLLHEIRKADAVNLQSSAEAQRLNQDGIANTLSTVYDRYEPDANAVFLGQELLNDGSRTPLIVYGQVWLQADNVNKISKRSDLDPGRIIDRFVIPVADGENEGIPDGTNSGDPLANVFVNGLAIIDDELGLANIADVTLKQMLGDGASQGDFVGSATGNITLSGTTGSINIWLEDGTNLLIDDLGTFAWAGTIESTIDLIVGVINGAPTESGDPDYLPVAATKISATQFKLTFDSNDGCKKNDWTVNYTSTNDLALSGVLDFSGGVCPKWSNKTASSSIGETDPATGERISSLDTPEATLKFSDLADVEVTSTDKHAIPYWDSEECKWKTKHINNLLIDINPQIEDIT